MFPNFRSQNIVKILEKMINTEFRRFQNFGISHLVTLPIVILDNYVKKFTRLMIRNKYHSINVLAPSQLCVSVKSEHHRNN